MSPYSAPSFLVCACLSLIIGAATPTAFVQAGSKIVATQVAQTSESATTTAAESEPELVPPPPFTNLAPLSPQPSGDAFSPGLGVTYYYEKFYTLDDVYDGEEPVPGEPIANLDQVTETENVLTSEQPILVGALIRGAIKFSEPGTYGFRVNSNDGVRLWIGDALLWEDPEVHYDRMSPPLKVVIDEAGWYDFKVDYFQKKGTAALQVLWTPPGGDEVPVPAEAFGHLN